MEKKSGQDCFRIDVTCLVKGRVRPRTSLWCDAETLMIREVQTQVASGGQYRTLQESYDSGPASMAPVLTSLTALPLDLPAFPSQEALGHGKGAGTFSYTSQPLPACAKDPGIIRSAHVVEQTIATARPKALESLARASPRVRVSDRSSRSSSKPGGHRSSNSGKPAIPGHSTRTTDALSRGWSPPAANPERSPRCPYQETG